MKHSFKKLTAWLCCMAMLISFIPATALPVFAAEAPVYTEVSTGALTAADFAETGAVKLTAATTASEKIAVAKGSDWYLDLNGQTVSVTITTLFQINGGGTLTITDSATGGKIDWSGLASASGNDGGIYLNGGTFNLEAGTLTGRTTVGRGGMVRVTGGTFNMNGGAITNNTATTTGGAVFLGRAGSGTTSTFNMTDGLISGNTVAGNGGAVGFELGGVADNYGVINISGGTISNNTVTGKYYGGGLYADTNGTITVSGDAVITGNSVTTASTYGGGGIAVKGGVANITGGTISANTAAGYGGGIYVVGVGEANISGGSITGNTAKRGGAISTVDGTNENAVINISGGTITGNIGTDGRGVTIFTQGTTTMSVTGGTIGSGLNGSGAAVTGINGAEECWLRGTTLTVSGKPVADSLNVQGTSTATIGELEAGASIKVFGAVASVHSTAAAEKGEDNGVTYTYQKPALPTSGDVGTGEYVLTGDIALAGALIIKDGSDVVIDLAGNTITADLSVSANYFNIKAGGKLTIKDSVGTGKVQFTGTAGSSGGISNYGTFVLEGGELNGWNRAGMGGFIDLWANSTFKMTGGKITGVSATSAGVIRTQTGPISAEFIGGEISGNTMTTAGGDIMRLGVNGTASTVHFGGDFKIVNNKHNNGEDFTAELRGIQANDAIMTIDGSAELDYFTLNNGTLNSEGGTYDAANGDTRYGRIDVTGSPVVKGIYRSTSGIALNISELTEGASISTLNGSTAQSTDATVGAETYDNSAISGLAKDKGTTYSYKIPTYAVDVEQTTGGTVTVDPAEGIDGATVTVTATADEGFELVEVLVDGVVIETVDGVGTFQIDADAENVVSATFAAVDVALPTSGAVAEGEYVLAADVALENTLSFAGDTVIDLNGKTITMTKANTVFFNVLAGGKLTIKDSVGGGKVQFNTTTGSGVYVSGEFVLESGTLTGYFRDGSGALFTVYAGGDFTMTGGSITGNGANAYGLMRAEGGDHTITITGGEITGNWNKSGYPMIQIGKTGVAVSTLTIGGDAVLAGNAYGGATFAESALWTACGVVEITTINTHVVIEDEAVVGYIRADGDAPAEGEAVKSSFTVTGAPTVAGMTWSSSSKTSSQIAELTEGAEVKTYSKSGGGVGEIDTTVVDNTYDNTAAAGGTGTDYDKGHVYTWRDPATVYTVTVGEVVNGTVTVDPAEGVYGTTVTVTATANEGYELEAILVNGKAIAGNTFTIGTANAEVTATFVEAAVEVTYDVIVIDPLGGTVSVDKNEAAEGETITITATADEGYELTAILVNGEAIEGTTFEMPAADVQVTATFTAVEPEGFPTAGNLAAGEYVLTEDVQLTNTLNVTGAVVIDLAGHSIYAKQGEGETASSGIFNLNVADGSLTINDSVGGGKLVACDTNGGSTPAVFVQKGIFTLNAGEITGWVREGGAGGMVYVLNGATFVMNGGKLTGAKSSGDGAIRAASGSTITIAGGEISGNTATGSSIINLVDGVNFTMTGGAIKNNTGVNGGALRIGSGNFTIAGGEISGNTVAKLGGGICVVSGASLTLSGVTVEDNACTDFSTTSSSFGGGVYVDNGASLTVNEGTVITGNSAVRGGGISTKEPAATATVTINGGTIEGNHASNRAANLYTYDSALTITGGTIGGALYGADKAAASAATSDFQNVQVRGGVVTVTGGNLAALDLGGNNGGTGWGTLTITGNPVIAAARVKVGSTVTSIGALTTGAVINTTEADALTIAENDETVAHEAGTKLYQFAGDLGLADKFVPGATVTLTEDTSVGGGIVLTEAGTYTLDLAGYTLTGITAPYFTVDSGAKLIITDSSAESTGKVVGLADAANAMILVNGGEFVLNDGLLTGNTNSSYGGAIYAPTAGSVVTIEGGEISGNTAYRGGAISTKDTGTAIAVTINIEGGVVTGNATNRGATIYTQTGATVVIDGGKVGYGTINGAPATIDTSGAEDLWIRNSVVDISGGDINGLYFNGNAANGYTLSISGATTIKCLCGATAEVASIGALEPGAEVILNGGALAVAEDDETVLAFGKNYYYPGDVQSILFVGNSFAGDSTQYLNAVGSFYGKKIAPAYLYVGSQNIRWHAQSLAESLREEDLNGDGVIGDSRDRVDGGLYTCAGFTGYVDIPTVMESTKWDYVVLQPGVEYVGFEGTYNSDIDFLMDYIADVQPEAQILWSQTWAVDNRSWSDQSDPDDPESAGAGEWLAKSSYLTQFDGSQSVMYDAILANTDKFISGANARFDFDGWFPIGIAIQTMRANYTDSYLTRDGFHLSYNAGRMIAALTVFKTLYPDVDLSTMTADDMAAMFKDTSTNHLKDLFDPTEENVATLLAAVETACANKTAIAAAHGNGTANKLFNPDGAEMGGSEYVAAYENVTEVGQVATNERYATTGAGKIVIFKDGAKIGALDEAWLDEQVADIDLGSRLANINGTYYIQADMQAPQLAVVGSKLYMTFDVKLYGDAQNTIINGGIYLTTSTDGITWTAPVKVSDAPMAYGLTALSDGTLLLSVADTATKVLKMDAAGAVTDTVELDAAIADAAFAEVDTKVWAMTSTGAVYYSTDMGETWTATAITGGAYASVDLVPLGKKGIFVTWADEETFDINYKIWTLDEADAYFGWNNSDVFALAEDYTVATAYGGKTTGGQPASFRITSGKNNTHERVIKTYYADGGKLQSAERGVIITSNKNLALESSLTINMKMMQTYSDKYGAASAKILRTYADKDSVWTEVDIAAGLEDGTVKIEGSGSNATYTFPYTGVAAKEMGDEVYLMLLDDEGKQISLLNMFSVEDYAYSQLKKVTEKTELATLLVDMLNYGAASQVYFGGYDVENLVNADLTETQQSWASELVSIDTSMSEGVEPAAVAKTTANVTTASVIELNVKFAITGSLADEISNAAYATVDYTTHMGTVMPTQTIQLSDGTANGLNTKDVKITSLATADVRTIVTVRLHRADGSVIEGTERTNNVSAYIYSQLKKGYDESNNLHVVLMRLMQYGDAAYAYKH